MTQAAATRFGIRSLALVVMALATLRAAGAHADTYPNRPVRLIVPFAAGGLNDVVARLVAPYLERSLGQPFMVDNRPAASGIVGTDATAKAPPDGYTLLMVASSFTVVPATNPKLPYDPERDLAPIVMVAKNSLLFLVNPKVPAHSLAEFVTLAKANPGKLNYASPGAATQTHLVVELFSRRADIKLQHIPYRGGAPAMTAMVAGDTQFTAISTLLSLPQIQAGALRAIANGSLSRDAQLPDLSTVAEQGFPPGAARSRSDRQIRPTGPLARGRHARGLSTYHCHRSQELDRNRTRRQYHRAVTTETLRASHRREPW